MFEIQLFIESFTSFVLSLFIEERSPFKDSMFRYRSDDLFRSVFVVILHNGYPTIGLCLGISGKSSEGSIALSWADWFHSIPEHRMAVSN